MTTKNVEVQRLPLDSKDATKLTDLMATLDGHRTQYGQHQFNLDYLRAQYENAVKQTSEEGDTLRKSIQEAQASVQEYSQGLLTTYEVDTSGGGWSLDTTEGAFIQYREEEVKETKKRTPKRKTAKARKPKKAPRKSPAKNSRRAAKKATAK